VELMIVVVVIGLLAAIAIPNFMSYENRAREAAVKSNMHAFQLASEDFRVRADSTYAGDAADVAPLVNEPFRNPFDKTTGEGLSWEDREYLTSDPTERRGITSYADSSFGMTYNIKGRGKDATLSLVLSSSK
jgi:type IV pilus assembly protein PilA